MRSVIFLVCIFLVTQCYAISFGSKKEPDWVKNPLPDTASTYYGIGSGQTAQLAKQAALEDIAGKLLTEVESSMEVNTQVDGANVSEAFSSNIKTSVKNVGLSGYSVDESTKKGKVYWVRIKLDKSTLVSSTASQLTPVMLELDTYFSSLDTYSALFVKREQDKLKGLLSSAEGKLFVLASVSSSPTYIDQQQKLALYQARLQQKLENVALYVQAEPEMQAIAGKLVHALNEDGWSASQQAGNGQPKGKGIVIKLGGHFKNSMQFGNSFSAATLRVDVIDEFGKVLSQQEFPIHGSSRSSHDGARQVAANKFLDDLRLEGVSEKLGLSE